VVSSCENGCTAFDGKKNARNQLLREAFFFLMSIIFRSETISLFIGGCFEIMIVYDVMIWNLIVIELERYLCEMTKRELA
jgi:hypothetical protein